MKKQKLQTPAKDSISIAEIAGLMLTGYFLHENGQVEKAQRIFEGLAVIDGQNPYVHNFLGAIYQKQGADEHAIAEYSRAIQLFPEDIAALVNRGEIRLKRGQFEEAADDLRRAIDLDRNGESPFANRARLLILAVRDALIKKEVV